MVSKLKKAYLIETGFDKEGKKTYAPRYSTVEDYDGKCKVCGEPLKRNTKKVTKEFEGQQGKHGFVDKKLKLKGIAKIIKFKRKVDTGISNQLVYYHSQCRSKRNEKGA